MMPIDTTNPIYQGAPVLDIEDAPMDGPDDTGII